eukprot:5662332-Prymnesium_polylepis.1
MSAPPPTLAVHSCRTPHALPPPRPPPSQVGLVSVWELERFTTEETVQLLGRAGRDGVPSDVLVVLDGITSPPR